MANGLGNKCAKHFCKRTLLVQLINKKHGHIFFGTRVQKRCFEKSSSPKKLFGIFSFWLRFDHVSLFEWNFADLLPSTHIYHFLKIYLNISSNGVNFYRAMRMHGTDCAVARCLSVCPSVRHTPVLCLNGYKILSRSGIPTILVFSQEKGWQNSDGTPERGRRMQGVWKDHDFRPISRCILQMMQDWAIVTIEGE